MDKAIKVVLLYCILRLAACVTQAYEVSDIPLPEIEQPNSICNELDWFQNPEYCQTTCRTD